MKTLGNIIWFIFGGLLIAIEYFLAGLALMLTIIGIPFGIQCIKLGLFALWPFGSKVEKYSKPLPLALPLGLLNIIMNIIWIIIGGFWIALTHLFWGIIFCITIIGIPFGKQHFKMIRLALFPFGKKIS